MNPHRRYVELAYIRAVPDMLHGTLKNGRLKNLYRKLQIACDNEFRRLPELNNVELEQVKGLLLQFSAATGWERKPRHISTLLSFCADMLERSQYDHSPKILKTLTDIIDYYARKEDFRPICCWAGSVAADKWEGIGSEHRATN